MKSFFTMLSAALAISALGAVMPEPAEAQKKRGSTTTVGPKKGQSTYRTPVTGRRFSIETAGRTRAVSTYRAAKVARNTKRTRGPKPKRTHGAQVSGVQAARNRQTGRSLSVQSSRPPSQFLERAPLNQGTSQGGAAGNRSGNQRGQLGGSGTTRQPQALLQPKPNAKLPAVAPSAQQRGILVTQNRARKHGTRGVTFAARDQFQAVNGTVTTARNGRGTGPINAIVRLYKSAKSKN